MQYSINCSHHVVHYIPIYTFIIFYKIFIWDGLQVPNTPGVIWEALINPLLLMGSGDQQHLCCLRPRYQCRNSVPTETFWIKTPRWPPWTLEFELLSFQHWTGAIIKSSSSYRFWFHFTVPEVMQERNLMWQYFGYLKTTMNSNTCFANNCWTSILCEPLGSIVRLQ